MKTDSLSISIITLGRQGSFYASELIGQPYGQTYEIVDKRLNPIAPPAFQEVGGYVFHSALISGY
jgi:hypothetical protein